MRDDDINTLLFGQSNPTVRITRIRSDLSHAAMTQDLILQASADQTELSNVRTVTEQIDEQCTLYQDCSAVGTGTKAQAVASVNQAESDLQGCRAAPSRSSDSPTRTVAAFALLAFVFLGMRRRT